MENKMKKLIALFAVSSMASTAAVAGVALSGSASVTYDDNGGSASATSYDADMTIEDIAHLDTTQLKDTFIKVIVRNKTNPYIIDLFLDRLQAASPCDIKVVEDHMNLDVIDESELVDEAQDTLTILKQYVQNLEISTDKTKIEKVLQELHNEAINL